VPEIIPDTNEAGSSQLAAAFEAVVGKTTEPLTVMISDNGMAGGSVTSRPSGISCPPGLNLPNTCITGYPRGASVGLLADPAPGWRLSGWSGACSGTAGCNVTMTSPESVTAAFSQVTTLQPGQTLHAGEALSNGYYTLVMQTDGNLVLYAPFGFVYYAAWSSGTFGHPGAWVTMQTDGNLVIYANEGHAVVPLWATGTAGNPGTYAALQSDRNFVLYAPSGPIWATNTAVTQGG
jgi:hypothetical protein